MAVYKEPDFYTMEKIFNASGKNGKEVVQKLVDAGKIEVRSATFLRGASIDSSLILVNECQNFSKESLLKILTRIGTDSKILMSGDILQQDNTKIRSGKSISGLQYAKDVLQGLPGVSITEFGMEDIIRNDMIPGILKRWLPETYGDLDLEKVKENYKKNLL
jgi:phosphate starvation-inducible PhoH-like protein